MKAYVPARIFSLLAKRFWNGRLPNGLLCSYYSFRRHHGSHGPPPSIQVRFTDQNTSYNYVGDIDTRCYVYHRSGIPRICIRDYPIGLSADTIMTWVTFTSVDFDLPHGTITHRLTSLRLDLRLRLP